MESIKAIEEYTNEELLELFRKSKEVRFIDFLRKLEEKWKLSLLS